MTETVRANKNPPPPERRRQGTWPWVQRHFFRKTARGVEKKPVQIELDRDIVMAALVIGLLLLGAMSGYILHQQSRANARQHELDSAVKRSLKNQETLIKQQKELSFLEKRDRIGSYQAAYRFCTRINVDRAALQALIM